VTAAVDGAGVVIVGGGHGGVEAAVALRLGGYDKPITVIDRGTHSPYERPPLSKAYLAGTSSVGEIGLRTHGYLSARGIDVRLGSSVAGIDRATRQVDLADGMRIGYEHVVLATGARPRQLQVPGSSARGVLGLATIEQADALRSQLRPGARLVIVGGGFIGLEVAATASSIGMDVTVVEVMDRLMARVLSPVMADAFLRRHREAGATILLGQSVEGLREDRGVVTGVTLSSGRTLPADVVLVGVGSEPAAELAVRAGLDTERGVLVDETCRTSDPSIFAIGDLVQSWHPRTQARIRLECVQNAVAQARIVATQILGRESPAPEVPWFWTDQHNLHLKIAGTSLGADATFVRGDPQSDRFTVGHTRRGQLICLEALNRPKEFMEAKRLIARGAFINSHIAEQPDTDLAAAEVPGQEMNLD